jgi:RNA-directed DNA polymerase
MMILPNGRVSPDTKKRQDLEVLLHFYLRNKAAFIEMIAKMKIRSGKNPEVSEEDCLDVLSGNLNYVDSIDPDYTDKLRRKFGAATIDMLIHRGLSKKS